jgi:acyl carrier protein
LEKYIESIVMENTQQIQEELFKYVKENTYKDTSNLTSDTMLCVEGILDSMGFALLLDFLEEKFKIKTADSDLIEENFESIDALTAFVQKKSVPVVQ